MTVPTNKTSESATVPPKRTDGKIATLLWLIILPVTVFLPAIGGTNLWRAPEVARASDSVLAGVFALGALVVFCLLLSKRWDSIPRKPAGLLEWCWIVVGLSLCIAGVSVDSVPLTSVGAIIVWGCALYVHQSADGSGALVYFFPPLLLCCSLPESLRQTLEGWTAQLLSVAVSPALDWLKIPFQQGNGSLVFASGILEFERFSIIPMTTLLVYSALLIVAWYRRPIASIPFYVAAASLWAFGMSVAKIVLLIVCMQASPWVGTEWLSVIVSVVCFALSLGLLFSTDRLVRILLFQVPAFDNKKGNNPILLAWNRAFQQMTVSGKLVSSAQTQSRAEHA